MNENREHCKMIADQLEAIAEGRMYICPECGEFIHESNFSGNTGHICPCCKAEEIALDDCEQATIFDYVNDSVLDIEYRISADRKYKSVRLMVACGGPNISIDTAECAVQLRWWTDREEFPLSKEASEAIDEAFEELYNC
jgi:hypothetical protein